MKAYLDKHRTVVRAKENCQITAGDEKFTKSECKKLLEFNTHHVLDSDEH